MNHPRLSIIPARAATDRALKPRDLQVLCVLGRHTDDLGWCRRSQVKMAQEMDCARSTVFESISRLVETGYLEKHVQETDSGRDSAHFYRVILDPKHPDPASIGDADDPCRYVGTPAGISAPPAGPEAAPPAGSGPAPINDPSLTTPLNGERERGGENPERAKSSNEAEARKECNRAHRIWPTYIDDSEPRAMAQWLALSETDRQAAVERMQDYISVAGKAGGRKTICAFDTYLREKRWEKLPPASETKKSDTLDAAPFGALWAIARAKQLVAGPKNPFVSFTAFQKHLISNSDDPDRLSDQLRRESLAKSGWPHINTMHERAANHQGVAVAASLEAFKDWVEAVPVGSTRYEEWKTHHEQSGWPWIPDPGRQPVVYFPVGGPARLDAFKQAVLGNDHDGNR